ncbi:unnamed protein product [Ectocarpus sp. CCAP 1310/34]|nr:unnamed protein product [Ectocarpus sp. CCAP 1310/34]
MPLRHRKLVDSLQCLRRHYVLCVVRRIVGRSRPYHWHTAASSTIHNNLCLSRCWRRR